MKALVFAAGHALRLRPLTDSMPKALVKVAGVPMLERVICKLRDSGFDDIVVNAHHFPEQIEAFIAEHDFGVPVTVCREGGAEALETGGGIRHAGALLESGEGHFLVHNVDILSDLDISALSSCVRPDALATLALEDKDTDRYLLFDDEMRLCGWTNVRTGEVRSPYPDLDPGTCHMHSFCGIHIISDAVFPLMEGWPDRFGIIDFYLKACRDHVIRGVLFKDLNLIDIGTPETLGVAERLMSGRDCL